MLLDELKSFEVKNALVGIYDLFQIRIFKADNGEGMVLIKVVVKFIDLSLACRAFGVATGKYSAAEISTDRNQVYRFIEVGLQLVNAHSYFFQMLMPEWFIHRNIVTPPAEMSGFGW